MPTDAPTNAPVITSVAKCLSSTILEKASAPETSQAVWLSHGLHSVSFRAATTPAPAANAPAECPEKKLRLSLPSGRSRAAPVFTSWVTPRVKRYEFIVFTKLALLSPLRAWIAKGAASHGKMA